LWRVLRVVPGNPFQKTLRAEAAAAFPIEEDTAQLTRRASFLAPH